MPRHKGEPMDFDKVGLELEIHEAELVRVILLKRVSEMQDDERFRAGQGLWDVDAASRIAHTIATKVKRLERLNALLDADEEA